MISLFRNFFQSKIGLPIFIGFLIIVALAFAATDISGTSTFGGLTGDDKIARVGDQTLGANEMRGAIENGLDRARQQNPTLTLQQFIEGGGLDSEIDLLIERYATGIWAQSYGLRAGDNLINSEILKIDAFRDLSGEFSPQLYQDALARQGISDAILRRDIGDGLLAQMVLRPALARPILPEAAARQYAALVLERRRGQIALIPSLDFAPEEGPSEAQLAEYYAENSTRFILPERRTLRFARFGADSVDTSDFEPTAQQIAARFEENRDQYAASERRAVSTFIVPTQEAANALVARIRGGISLEAAAQEAQFQVSAGPLRDKESLAQATSFALAERAFAAQEGDILEPARSTLGWYVARVDDVERTPARSLAQVRDEIAQALRDEQQATALIELSTQIEDLVDSGSSLTDIATRFGLEVNVVPGVTADGQLYGQPGPGLNPILAPVLETAFQMDESEPQLTALVDGSQFLIFDVDQITESAPPPLEEIEEVVRDAWLRAEGSKRARAAADRILAAVRSGTPLAEALRAESAGLDQIETIDLRRTELLDGRRNVPTPLVLLFSMAQGSTKLLEDANDLGWYIVDLETIETDPIEDNPDTLRDTQGALAQALVAEYGAQLGQAIRDEVGVERNEEAIARLRASLLGQN